MKFKKIKEMKVSAIGFGCWAIGGEWDNVSDEQSQLAIKEAINQNINFFDVAPIYGKGHAEKVLGSVLKNERRSDIIIASKCGLTWDPIDLSKKAVNNLTKNSILKEIEDSLKRLNTDYIDLYQLHWPDPKTPIKETASALIELKEQGLIKHVGVSNFSLDMTKELQQHIEISTFQGLYNLLEQNPTEYHNIPLSYRARDEALPFCNSHDIKYLPYSPLMQGLLTGNFKKSNNWDKSDVRMENPKLNGDQFIQYYNCVEELKALAVKEEIKLSHLALHWLTNQKEVGPILAGAFTKEQVKDNASFVNNMIKSDILLEAECIVKRWKLA